MVQHTLHSGPSSQQLPPPSLEGWAPKPWPPISEMPPFSVIHDLWSHRRVSMERRTTRRKGHRHSEPIWRKNGSPGHHLRWHVGHVWRWEEWRKMRIGHARRRLQRWHTRSGTLRNSQAWQGHCRCYGRPQVVVCTCKVWGCAFVCFRFLSGILQRVFTSCCKRA